MPVSIADAKVANWVGEISNTVGDGPLTLAGPYQNLATFSLAFGGLPTVVFYSIKNGNNWEAGIANFDGVNGLDRDTPSSTFFNGVFDNTTPSRIVLSGQSIVRCSFNTIGFENFLTKQLLLQNIIVGDDTNEAVKIPISDLFTVENGFENRTDSVISFNESTREFTIAPAVDQYRFWSDSKLYIKTGPDTVTIPDIEDLVFIYFDQDSLIQLTTTFFDEIITRFSFVAVIDWSFLQQKAILVGEERHGHQMSSATHLYNHHTTGSRYAGGFSPINVVADGDGDLDSSAQFGYTGGEFWDEDIRHTFTDGIPQVLEPVAQMPVLYRKGTEGHWISKDPDGFPVVNATTGSFRIAFNEFNGSEWVLTEANNLDFVLCHIVITNDIRMPYMALVGQNQYGSIGSARQGAVDEINQLSTGGITPLFPEFVIAQTFIYQTSNQYSNAVMGRIRTTDEGDDFVDWRGQNITSGAGAGITLHSQLGGLSGDDHLQYASLGDRDNVFNTANQFLGTFDVGDPGIEIGSVLVNGVVYPATAKINRFGTGVIAELVIHRHSDTDNSHILFSRSLSNDDTHTDVIDGTFLGDLTFAGWAIDSYWLGASIRAVVDGTPGSGDMPTRINFLTSPDGAAAPQVNMSIRADGTIEGATGNYLIQTPDAANEGSINVRRIVGLTQTEYNASVQDANTLYVVTTPTPAVYLGTVQIV